MKTGKLIILFFLGITLSTFGQSYSSSNKKAIKHYEKAMTAIYQGRSDEARNGLAQALKEDPDFLEAHLVLADLAMYDVQAAEEAGPSQKAEAAKYRKEAKNHYLAVVERKADFFVPAWVELGKLELAEGNNEKAISCFETYIKMDKRKGESLLEAKNGLATAKFRIYALAHPVPFEPKNLGTGVNSSDDEYLPSLTADGQTLVFTRRFARTAATTANTKEEEDLYVSTLKENRWQTASRMPEPLNSTDNEGAQCMSQDGRIMFFTACGRPNGNGRCDIYLCVNNGGKWSEPRNLGPSVNGGSWEGQPTFSIDGKTLYFVSNRDGGFGGMDIWKSVFENGKWSKPENLGPEINTEWDEMSPFIHFDDRTLYFASNRSEGMGGKDIFMSRKTSDGRWGKPTNLGYPINTDGDENNLIVSADGHTAFFASNREGGQGKMDIYSFDLPQNMRPDVAICFKGRVSDAKTGNPLAADIKVVDLRSGKVVANTSSEAKNGGYIVSLPADGSYAFHVSAEGYLLHSQSETWEREREEYLHWKPVIVDIALRPMVKGEKIALRNVFFNSGKWELLEESQYELDKLAELLEENPELRIELGGHTDNVGKSEDNQRLSEMRAKAVYEYLTAKGIAPSRLAYKGYGETQPIETNDTEEGRSANRRTEIKVL